MGELEADVFSGVTKRRDVNIDVLLDWQLDAFFFDGQEHAFHAGCKSHAWDVVAADLADEFIVTAAATDGVLLAADFVHDDFKGGLGVVVESAHEGGVDVVFDADAFKITADFFEMGFAVVAGVVQGGWCAGGNGFAAFFLAV